MPYPFDKWMKLDCQTITGQRLVSVRSSWSYDETGDGIDLTPLDFNNSPRIARDAGEYDKWPFTYYTSLMPARITSAAETRLRLALSLRAAYHFGMNLKDPDYVRATKLIDDTDLMEMDVAISNGQSKQIFLIIPRIPAEANGFLGDGMECVEHCLPFDKNAIFFSIAASNRDGDDVPVIDTP